MNILELNAADIAAIDKEKAVVLIPIGSVEQHGPHLPLGSKCFLSEAIAWQAESKLKAEGIIPLIAPVFPYMPCQTSFGFKGCYSMAARTYSDALYEIGHSFKREGFAFVYFVNLSISPDALKAVSVAVEDLNTLNDFRAYDPLPLWNFSPSERLDAILKEMGLEPANELHGDVKETSALLALDEELVDKSVLPQLNRCQINPSWEILKGNFSFIEMGSNSGYIGSPDLADPEIGRLYLEEGAFALSEAIKFTLEGNELPELPLQIRMLLKMVDLDEM
jgi:creatinine amidohydrolase/Fe(II)-dependent formamide hydrolase-like protein